MSLMHSFQFALGMARTLSQKPSLRESRRPWTHGFRNLAGTVRPNPTESATASCLPEFPDQRGAEELNGEQAWRSPGLQTSLCHASVVLGEVPINIAGKQWQ